MWTRQLRWKARQGWDPDCALESDPADLVLCFGDTDAYEAGAFEALRAMFPKARIVASTAVASIQGHAVIQQGAVAAAVGFSYTRIEASCIQVGAGASFEAGRRLAAQLAAGDRPAGILLLADGLGVNGSELLAGLRSVVPAGCTVFGGMTTGAFGSPSTSLGLDARPGPGNAAAVGFYGPRLRIGDGTAAGWDVFGPVRHITGSDGNLLKTLDGRPALDLYRRYLGDEYLGPEGHLLFPLLVWPVGHPEQAVVRTLIRHDDEGGKMLFAGNVPEGYLARLMRGSLDRVAMAAADAARMAMHALPADAGPGRLALMVSCIGRLRLLGQKAPEEVEDAAAELGDAAGIGFYSYGEICRSERDAEPQLHNQTMSVTLLAEAAGHG
ncbi:conserved protein of unknown function [Rhodovastum atsumiense]|nr:FIST N-terminal domain-containing protein [Rhodovastum atsumiense]CAH2602298.1 conserved protein of unknown function [Rhodovastum atsumiense]